MASTGWNDHQRWTEHCLLSLSEIEIALRRGFRVTGAVKRRPESNTALNLVDLINGTGSRAPRLGDNGGDVRSSALSNYFRGFMARTNIELGRQSHWRCVYTQLDAVSVRDTETTSVTTSLILAAINPELAILLYAVCPLRLSNRNGKTSLEQSARQLMSKKLSCW